MSTIKIPQPLEECLKKMGIKNIDFEKFNQLFKKKKQELELKINSLAYQKDIVQLKNDRFYVAKLMSYCVLYYSEQDLSLNYNYHLTRCNTVENQLNNHNYYKFSISAVTTGFYIVKVFDYNTNTVKDMIRKHNVCENCLKKLNYQGYKYASEAEKKRIRDNFNLEKFIKSEKP